MQNKLHQYFPVAEAICQLLHPYGEVVIHDLKTGLIAAIYNPFSKRKIGDESLIEELSNYDQLPNVFPSYTKVNWDGRMLKSSTATLRDSNGIPMGLLCINLDLSKWEELHQLLGEWLGQTERQQKPQVLFTDDWREKINAYVSEYLKRESTTLKLMGKEKKRELVRALHREGAFKAKHAASYVADVLDLSRATIYNYLRSG